MSIYKFALDDQDTSTLILQCNGENEVVITKGGVVQTAPSLTPGQLHRAFEILEGYYQSPEMLEEFVRFHETPEQVARVLDQLKIRLFKYQSSNYPWIRSSTYIENYPFLYRLTSADFWSETVGEKWFICVYHDGSVVVCYPDTSNLTNMFECVAGKFSHYVYSNNNGIRHDRSYFQTSVLYNVPNTMAIEIAERVLAMVSKKQEKGND